MAPLEHERIYWLPVHPFSRGQLDVDGRSLAPQKALDYLDDH
jgi:hypothetical protein